MRARKKKDENACEPAVYPITTMFSNFQKITVNVLVTFIMSSANKFIADCFKVLLFGRVT